MAHFLARLFRDLPEDVVHHIWRLSFPRVFLRCSACGAVILTIDADRVVRQYALGYSVLHGSCRCALCLARGTR